MKADSRREKYRQELRTDILNAARELFVHEGYESFSMRKLAARIEYSPATIYQHFKSKDELFQCLVKESFARLGELQARAAAESDKDPVAALKRGLRTYVEFGLQHPNHYRFAFLLESRVSGPYTPHAAFESLEHKVRRCIEAKRFRTTDVDTAAQSLWAAVHGVTSLLIVKPQFPWVAREKLIGQVIESAVLGLSKESTKSTPRRT
jgi:AcrR family transcriptional regulator